ncbi:hypothetical protein Ahy_A09g045241 [Arachis hypogaea]|uniref:Protein FAR1-RELATED SEQUENCE n=1 Tax=Arachis hypogaea TaxID=3818 RepID=A0A445BLX5_ARAHY|nr:hypothetical protein Ahy_A09g045241 [Arachis hypogaea]
MKYENLLDFPEYLIYKRWSKNAKNDFSSIIMHVNNDVERVLNKLCDLACKNNVDFEEVQSEIVKLIICLQSRKHDTSLPNTNELLPVDFRGGKREHARIAIGMAINTSDVQIDAQD